jgi:hypothetical protein
MGPRGWWGCAMRRLPVVVLALVVVLSGFSAPAGAAKAKKCKAKQSSVVLKPAKRGKSRICLGASPLRLDGSGTVADALVGGAFGGIVDGVRKRGKPVGPSKALKRIRPGTERGLDRIMPTMIDAVVLSLARSRNPDAGVTRRMQLRSGIGGATFVSTPTGGTFTVPEYGMSGTVTGTTGSGGGVKGTATVEVTGETAREIFGGDVTVTGKVELVKSDTNPLGYDVKELELALVAKGIRISVRVTEKVRAKGDTCPTIAGEAKETATLEASLSFEVAVNRPRLTLAKGSVEITYDGESKGQTADDAKLDTLDSSLRGTFQLRLDTRGTGIAQDFTVERRAIVDMRKGGQQTVSGQTTLNVDSSGLIGALISPTTPEQLAATLKKYEKTAQETAKSELDGSIRRFREREENWLKPGTCLQLTWNPASESKTVKAGETGTINGTLQAVRDGKSPKGIWTRAAQQNATFTPDSRTTEPGAQGAFNWTVTGDSGHASGTYRVTSMAGVAEVPWRARILPPFRYYRVLAASMTEHVSGESVTMQYTGTKDAGVSVIQEQPFDPTDDVLYPNGPNGEYTGKIWVVAEADADAHMSVPGYPDRCELDDHYTEPDAPVGFSVDIGPNATMATIKWFIRGPGVGIQNWPLNCYPQPIGGPPPGGGFGTAQVPVEHFKAAGPQTLTFQGTALDLPGYGADGPGATLDLTVDLSLTFQQVNSDGTPIAP